MNGSSGRGASMPPLPSQPPAPNGSAPVSANGQVQPVKQARPTTGYCFDATMMMHRPSHDSPDDPHPEQPKRILRIYEALKLAGCVERMQKIKVREVVKSEVMLVHSEELWNKVYETVFMPPEQIYATIEYYNRLSLYINESSALCARLSCGGVIETCRAVAEGQVKNAFAIVRPPGHHAEPEESMGFCFFNNVAVAAQTMKYMYADKGIKKILILDWDVHHGNGTQKAFWNDPDVLYISLHMFKNGLFYPGGIGGASDQVGEGAGTGLNVNIPWENDGMDDADYLYAFQRIVMPIAFEFAPDFILVSAGYDAAEGDDLGSCKVTPAGYAHMTHMLSSLANGKLVLALEGGYNLDAIATSALACVNVLLGEQPPKLPSLTASESATQVMFEVAKDQAKYWKSISPTVGESREEASRTTSVIPISDVLKAHRAYYLYYSCNLVNTELTNDRLQSLFEDQVFCSENVFSADTLVVFMHDMGIIRTEIGSKECNLQVEKSYLIDSTTEVINWVGLREYGLIDVNVLAKSPTQYSTAITRDTEMADEKALALHIWDNFVELSQAKSIIFIGLSSGCAALTGVINERSKAVRRKLKTSVMICGMQKPPLIAEESERPGLRKWYYEVSRIYCPSTHNLIEPRMAKLRKYGQIQDSGEPRAEKVLQQSWTSIQKFIAGGES